MAENKVLTTAELCEKLLQDDAALAKKAAAKVETAVQGKSEKEAAMLTAQQCRKLLLKEDSYAFEDIKSARLISEQFAFSEIQDDDEEGCVAYLISQLSHRHRFEYILKTEAGLDTAEIAKCLKLKPTEVENDLAAAWNTMTRTLDSMQKDKEEPVPMYAVVREKITEQLSDIELPEQTRVRTYINTDAARPKREKVKKPPITAAVDPNAKNKKLKWIAGSLVIVGVVIVMLVSIFGGGYAGGYYADIEIENYGTVTVQLNERAAPITVENFINLAQSDFYDGKTFHRIIEGFMMQGGSLNGDGIGDGGATIVGEFEANGIKNPLPHTRGAISMARTNQSYDSASTQFFIVHQDNTESLDGLYAAFGYVVSGMEIVDKICSEAQPIDGNGMIAAENQPIIKNVTIREVE